MKDVPSFIEDLNLLVVHTSMEREKPVRLCMQDVLLTGEITSGFEWLLQACVGRQKCAVPIVSSIFGDDPCPGLSKSLAVTATCA